MFYRLSKSFFLSRVRVRVRDGVGDGFRVRVRLRASVSARGDGCVLYITSARIKP